MHSFSCNFLAKTHLFDAVKHGHNLRLNNLRGPK